MFPTSCAKSLQLCPTLSDPMDCSPLGSSVHGILQASVLEWVAIPFSRGSSPPRDAVWSHTWLECQSWTLQHGALWPSVTTQMLPPLPAPDTSCTEAWKAALRTTASEGTGILAWGIFLEWGTVLNCGGEYMTQNLPKLTKLYTNKAGRILLYENYALTTGKFSFEVCKFTLTHLKYCR